MKKTVKTYLFPLLALLLVATSCDSFLTEQPQNGKYSSEIWETPKFAEGVLLKGYQLINGEYFSNNYDKDDYATSDMVTNVPTDEFVSIATGEWTSRKTPLSIYNRAYEALLHINDFLQHVDGVDFAPESEQEVKDKYVQRLKGEAYGLRAYWNSQLLRAHAGMGKNGELLGFPIVTKPVSGAEAFIPRSSFVACVDFIKADCDSAIALLPAVWEGDDRVMGETNRNRINGTIAKVIKSRVLLWGASEAFNASGIDWSEAATLSAEIMAANGGITSLDPDELEFYTLGTKATDCKHIFWCTSYVNNTTRESNHYAPTLYGKAKVNPSQNLVDCFPAANGYPISDVANSGYNAATPFAGRDPRLKMFIYADGDAMHGGAVLDITAGTANAPGNITSSRTGYYLRKLLDETTDLTAGAITKGNHYRVLARYTEVLLNFAEAANEAGGPDVAVGGYTARAVINAIRTRAGITDQTYVNGLDQAGLRDLIRNERRIELCFESFRFWDIRRWKDTAAMTEDVKGITKTAGAYSVVNIESRTYEDYMIYGPIPYAETLKYALVQNEGWE